MGTMHVSVVLGVALVSLGLAVDALRCVGFNKSVHIINDKCFNENEKGSHKRNAMYKDIIKCIPGDPPSSLQTVKDPIMGDLGYNVSNKEQGLLDIYFKLTERDCLEKPGYRMYLMLNKTMHSCSSVFSSEDCPSCNMTAVVSFPNVFKGFYELRTKMSSPTITSANNTPLGEINTDYIKPNSSISAPIFIDYNNKTNILKVEFEMPNKYAPDLVYLTLIITGSSSIYYKLVLDKTDASNTTESRCNLKNIDPYSSTSADENIITLPSNTTIDDRPHCTYYNEVNSPIYSCEFFNMQPNNYTVRIEIEETQCQHMTVFASNALICNWLGRYYHSELGYTLIPTQSYLMPHHICLVVIVLLTVSGIYFFLIFIYEWMQDDTESNKGSELIVQTPSLTDDEPSVVLLYAKDCELFMDMMAQFRSLLGAVGCKVYDFWDPMSFNKVAETMTGWVRNHLDNKDTCFVLVTTMISNKIEKSTDWSKVVYKNPQSFDGLFLYAVTSLQEVIITESYRRIYVVRFQNFTVNKTLTSINSTVVYSLPVHLDTLVNAIKNKPFDDFPTLDGLPEAKKFKELIKKFEEYTGNAWDYIYDIIIDQDEL